jgi:hypothetical protein
LSKVELSKEEIVLDLELVSAERSIEKSEEAGDAARCHQLVAESSLPPAACNSLQSPLLSIQVRT